MKAAHDAGHSEARPAEGITRESEPCPSTRSPPTVPFRSAPSASSPSSPAPSALVRNLRNRLARRATVAELRRLSDDQLADIGLTRADVAGFARGR